MQKANGWLTAIFCMYPCPWFQSGSTIVAIEHPKIYGTYGEHWSNRENHGISREYLKLWRILKTPENCESFGEL